MSELVPLDNLDNNTPGLENTGAEETNFGGTEENIYENPYDHELLMDNRQENIYDDVYDDEAPLDDKEISNGLNWMSRRGKPDLFKRLFGDREDEAEAISNFMEEVMEKSREYKNIRFIKYLLDKHGFKIKKIPTEYIDKNNYEFEYNIDSNYIKYQTMNGGLRSKVFKTVSGDMDDFYDEWKNEVRKERIKKGSLVGGVLIAIAGLVSGLALGLKRTGHNMVHDSKVKWKKLTPAEKKQIVIPWTKLEEASGKSVILVGDYLYVLIGGTILIYILRK